MYDEVSVKQGDAYKQVLHHFHLSERVIVYTLHCHFSNLADTVSQSDLERVQR